MVGTRGTIFSCSSRWICCNLKSSFGGTPNEVGIPDMPMESDSQPELAVAGSRSISEVSYLVEFHGLENVSQPLSHPYIYIHIHMYIYIYIYTLSFDTIYVDSLILHDILFVCGPIGAFGAPLVALLLGNWKLEPHLWGFWKVPVEGLCDGEFWGRRALKGKGKYWGAWDSTRLGWSFSLQCTITTCLAMLVQLKGSSLDFQPCRWFKNQGELWCLLEVTFANHPWLSVLTIIPVSCQFSNSHKMAHVFRFPPTHPPSSTSPCLTTGVARRKEESFYLHRGQARPSLQLAEDAVRGGDACPKACDMAWCFGGDGDDSERLDRFLGRRKRGKDTRCTMCQHVDAKQWFYMTVLASIHINLASPGHKGSENGAW